MIKILLKTATFSFAIACASSVLAQAVDLRAARETVIDLSMEQLSTLESVVNEVPTKSQGKITEGVRANEASRNHALAALNRAQKGEISKEEGIARAYDAVELGTRKHTEVLTDLLDRVPEEARPGIERALQVSQRGRNTALSALSDIKQGRIAPSAAKSAASGTDMGPPTNLPKPSPGGVGKPDLPGKVGGPFGRGGPFGAGGPFGGKGPGGIPGGVRPGR